MTLSEIETILEQLAVRHPNLDKVMLTTLLTSAGWEEKTIKEALVLFAQRKPTTTMMSETPVPQVSVLPQLAQISVGATAPEKKEEPLTFIQPDGSEEGVLPVFKDEVIKRNEAPKISYNKVEVKDQPSVVEEKIKPEALALVIEVPKEEIKTNDIHMEKAQPDISSIPVPPVATVEEQQIAPLVKTEPQPKEPESLIIHDEVPVKRNVDKSAEIPDNLPLLPFESSPHVWSFSKYKDMFHKEAPYKEEIQVITVMPQEEKSKEVVSKKVSPKIVVVEEPDEEIVIEKTPLSKGDESLVFLAGMMLFVIILILGYMYSNGRL